MSRELPDLFDLAMSLADWSVAPVRHSSALQRNAMRLQLELADVIKRLCAWLNDEEQGSLASHLAQYYQALVAQAGELDTAYSEGPRSGPKVEAEERAFQAAALRVAHVIRSIDEDRDEWVSAEDDETGFCMPSPKGAKWRELKVYPLFADMTPRDMLAVLQDWLKSQHLIDAAIARKDMTEAFMVWIESLQVSAIVQRAAIENEMPLELVRRVTAGLHIQVSNAGALAYWGDLCMDFTLPDSEQVAASETISKANANREAVDYAGKLQEIYQGKASAVPDDTPEQLPPADVAFGRLVRATEKHRLMFLYFAFPQRWNPSNRTDRWDTLPENSLTNPKIPADDIDSDGEFLFRYRAELDLFAHAAIERFGSGPGNKPRAITDDGRVVDVEGGQHPCWGLDAISCRHLEESCDVLLEACRVLVESAQTERYNDVVTMVTSVTHDGDASTWYPSVLVSWEYLQKLDDVIRQLKVYRARGSTKEQEPAKPEMATADEACATSLGPQIDSLASSSKKPIDRMLFTEDLSSPDDAISAALTNFVADLTSFANCLVSKRPRAYLTDGEDDYEFSSELTHRRSSVKEIVDLAWCHPMLSPAHAQDLNARFEKIVDAAEKHPEHFEAIWAEEKKRMTFYYELYAQKFSSDRGPLEREIQSQGGFESHEIELMVPGRTPSTIRGIANAIRGVWHSARMAEGRCQWALRQEVMDYIDLLVVLNNTIVAPHIKSVSAPKPPPTPPPKPLNKDPLAPLLTTVNFLQDELWVKGKPAANLRIAVMLAKLEQPFSSWEARSTIYSQLLEAVKLKLGRDVFPPRDSLATSGKEYPPPRPAPRPVIPPSEEERRWVYLGGMYGGPRANQRDMNRLLQSTASNLKGFALGGIEDDKGRYPVHVREFFKRWSYLSWKATGFQLVLERYDRDGHCDLRNSDLWETFLLTMGTLTNSPVRLEGVHVVVDGNDVNAHVLDGDARMLGILALRRFASFCTGPVEMEDLGLADGASTFKDVATLVELVNDVRKEEGNCPRTDNLVRLTQAAMRALAPMGNRVIGKTLYGELVRDICQSVSFRESDTEAPGVTGLVWGATEDQMAAIVRKLRELQGRVTQMDIVSSTSTPDGVLNAEREAKEPSGPNAKPKKIPKKPSAIEDNIAKYYESSDKTQIKAAEQLNKSLGKMLAEAGKFPLTQKKISEIVKKVNAWREANGESVIPTRKAKVPPSIDPSIIDMGERVDKKSTQYRPSKSID